MEVADISDRVAPVPPPLVFVSSKCWKLVCFRVPVSLGLRGHGWIGSSHRAGRHAAEGGGTLGHGRSFTFQNKRINKLGLSNNSLFFFFLMTIDRGIFIINCN